MWKYRQRKKRIYERRCGKRVQLATNIVILLERKKIDTPSKLYLRVMVYQKNRKQITPQGCMKFAKNELLLEQNDLYDLYEISDYKPYNHTPQYLYNNFIKDVAQLVWYNTHNLQNNKLQNKFYDANTQLIDELKH